MAGVDAALQSLHPVVLLDVSGDDALLRWDKRPLWPRQSRTFLGRTHIDPDDASGFLGRIRRGSDFVLEVGFGWLIGHIDARAVGGELPAVVDTSDATFFVSAEEQGSATVGTIVLNDSNLARSVAEGDQLLAHEREADRRAVGLGQLG